MELAGLKRNFKNTLQQIKTIISDHRKKHWFQLHEMSMLIFK